MYCPDREKIFEDIDPGDECDNMSCHNYMQAQYAGKASEPVCMASAHGECVRVNMIASEINRFIGDNDDAFMYISAVGEK